ncbi:ABC transporter ATP-binding protein [Nisaea acidiphila]|uniref:ABC transporter ATP-binding protein n=1 Tax=Nisaea acidiphila TaxID=1862145 RepID=A0A9J7AM73_9PROT|nr:ABC transporter ATP-binding protein [Nisaea acidiphila]UUX48568.1 ABC transporter ATP-binding protein [Nisaea acidiphila]
MLTVDNLSVAYGRNTVLQDVTFHLPSGSPGALIGPNGTGKSSLLRAIAGLQRHGGTIALAGDAAPAGRIAYMPQDTAAASSLTALEVTLLGRLGKLGLRVARSDIEASRDVLHLFGLTDKQDVAISALSGGQRQMVYLAQALVRSPDVLLLDEPTAALDLRHQLLVLDTVADLCRERNIVVLAAMHDLTLAGRFAERMIGLGDGRIVAEGTPEHVMTPDSLADLYRVTAEVSRTSSGRLAIVPTGLAGPVQ